MEEKTLRQIGGVAAIIVGLIHIVFVAFDHVEPLPLETIFFTLGGLAQVLWGATLLRKCDKNIIHAGIVIHGGLIVLWALTRIFRAPFMEGPEAVGMLGLVVVLLELIILAVITRLDINIHQGKKYSEALVALLALSIVAGGVHYALARGLEIVFPDRVVEDHHAEEVDLEDNHDEEEPHNNEDDHGE